MEIRLTPEQKIIMLRLCNAAEPGSAITSLRMIQTRTVREGATASALARKGLAERLPNGRYQATSEGYWLGDALRIERRAARSS